MLNSSSEKTIAKLLYLGVPAVSLLVTGFMSYDPVNVGKMVITVGIGFSIWALVLKNNFGTSFRYQKSVFLAVAFFIVAGVSSTLASDAPLEQNIFGVFGRNTGFLTYLGLAGVLVGASLIRKLVNYEKLSKGLIVAGLVNVAVCATELAGYNLFGFNNIYKNILGTFGNPNFISSFLGIFASTFLAYIFSPGVAVWIRVSAPFIIGLAFYEILDSNSIQGVVVAVLGFTIVGFLVIRSYLKSVALQFTYLVLAVTGGGFGVAGALQIGPLTEVIYKTSVSLRGEYWRAGIKMGMDHPLTGVGFDTYGDWYRRARSASAMILPGPGTVTNSAHNVNIDIFSYGGFPLLISYLALVVLAGIAVVKVVIRSKGYDKHFFPLATAWVCYQAQAIISINQIGLAVWGWALTGAVIGYEKISRTNEVKNTLDTGSGKAGRGVDQGLAATYLVSVVGFSVGIILAFPAFLGDSSWRSAIKSGSVELVQKSANQWPRDSYKMASTVALLEENKFPDLAYPIALSLTGYNPNYFDGWRMLTFVSKSSVEDKKLALDKMKVLDPLNKEIK
jgi:O-antigen ligase